MLKSDFPDLEVAPLPDSRSTAETPDVSAKIHATMQSLESQFRQLAESNLTLQKEF